MDKETPKRRRGRPSGQVLTEEMRVRLDSELLAAIDNKRKSLGLATRSAFVRFVLTKELQK
jgi:hypothetical protein